MCWNTYFYSVFEEEAKIDKTRFSHFAKHRFIKNVLLQPPFGQKLVFFNLGLLKPKTLMMNKKHNLKSGNSKDKKRDSKEQKRQEPKQKRNIDPKKLQLNVFDVVPFVKQKQKQRRKKRKEREKNKESKESKKRQEGRHEKKRTRERQRKRNWKRERPKKAKEKQKGDTQN